MKNTSNALLTFLIQSQAAEMAVCDLLTITLVDGTVLYYCNADTDVTWGGQVYSSGSSANIIFSRTKTSCKTAADVAEMDLTIIATASAVIEGTPALTYIRNAGLDGAAVRVDRLFFSMAPSNAGTPIGIVNNFVGRASNLQLTRLSCKVTVKSWLVLMDTQLPKNTYQPTCLHSLYDAGCTVSRAVYQVSSAVAAGSTVNSINSGLSQAPNYFTQGYIQFTGGINNGVRRTIINYSSGVFNLGIPLFNAPNIGDTFNVYPGCDHTSSTCSSKFSNLANFRGFEFVPVPETSL